MRDFGFPLNPALLAQQGEAAVQDEEPAPTIPNDQLDSMVAPVALYSDHLLGQVLVASTYPWKIMQLDQWMKKNTTLKDKAFSGRGGKTAMDPSVQGWLLSRSSHPDVRECPLDIGLGNAFLAQQARCDELPSSA